MSSVLSFIPFSRRDMAGALVVNVFAIISAVGLLSVAIRVVYLGIQHLRHRSAAQSKEYGFYNTQLGYYAICLLVSNSFNSAAGLLGISYLVQGGIPAGSMICTMQATIMQFGSVGTAYFTAAIVVHTFMSLVLRKRQSFWVYFLAIAIGWTLAGVIATLPLYQNFSLGPIYGASGLACGVRQDYPRTQFLLHLLPIFISAIVSAILYALIFLVLRGTLILKGGIGIRLNPDERWSVRVGRYQQFVAGIARSMLWFPVAYIVLLVPYSVTRLLAMGGYNVPFEALVFAFTCWFMLGVVNVILLYNTFRVLSPAFNAASGSSSGSGRASFTPNDMYKSDVEKQSLDTPSGPGMLAVADRAVSVSSYYGAVETSQIARKISSVAILNQGISDSPRSPPQARVGSVETSHFRYGSADSLLSLPTPPRRRSPAGSVVPTWMPSEPPSASQSPNDRQSYLRMSGRSEELDVSSWLARQNPDGSMPRGTRNDPLLSAVASNFSTSSPHSRNLTSLPGSPVASLRDQRGGNPFTEQSRPPINGSSYL